MKFKLHELLYSCLSISCFIPIIGLDTIDINHMDVALIQNHKAEMNNTNDNTLNMGASVREDARQKRRFSLHCFGLKFYARIDNAASICLISLSDTLVCYQLRVAYMLTIAHFL